MSEIKDYQIDAARKWLEWRDGGDHNMNRVADEDLRGLLHAGLSATPPEEVEVTADMVKAGGSVWGDWCANRHPKNNPEYAESGGLVGAIYRAMRAARPKASQEWSSASSWSISSGGAAGSGFGTGTYSGFGTGTYATPKPPKLFRRIVCDQRVKERRVSRGNDPSFVNWLQAKMIDRRLPHEKDRRQMAAQ